MPEEERPGGLETAASLVAGLAAALVAWLFRGATVVPAGVFDGIAVAALGLGAAPLAARALAPAAAPVARGAGLAAASVVAAAALLPPFDRAALPLAAWVLGGALLQASTRARRNGVVLASVGVLLLLLGCAVAWQAASAWPETQRLRLTVVASAALVLAGLALRLRLARRAPALAPSPAGVLVGAALAVTYVAYRPLVAGQVANLPLYEWTLGVGVAVLLLGRLRRSARDASVAEAWSGTARRHAQDAAAAYDPRMPPLAAAIQRYLESGEGFDDYRAAMTRAAPHASPAYRKALQGMSAVQARGRGSKAARGTRLAAHQELMDKLKELPHGEPAPGLRAHP
ncbi:MAG TPA: hypothetical protein VM582_06750 [Candidatus Thermoplasmatota archaeon]|nr:hypothetical protein [Candidatus Thermoplasmatota archaeon]